MTIILALLASVARTVAGALVNPLITTATSAPAWASYLGLAATLAERGAAAQSDLNLLDVQLKEAVSANRGLTPEQLAGWKARDDAATATLQAWLDSHPKTKP